MQPPPSSKLNLALQISPRWILSFPSKADSRRELLGCFCVDADVLFSSAEHPAQSLDRSQALSCSALLKPPCL